MRLTEVADLLRDVRKQAAALAHDESLRRLLNEEQTWLLRMEATVDKVRYLCEFEAHRFWPAVLKRWAVALIFALASAAAAGAGYVAATRPYEAELVALRGRVELLDAIAQRLITMTPAERRQFDALMKWDIVPKR
jgi:hypothetical protein